MEINSELMDAHPSISTDGLTLYFTSNRNDVSQAFKTTRESTDTPFGPPEHLFFFDAPHESVSYPTISGDGTALYFVRWPEKGTTDIYVSYIVTYYIDIMGGSDSNDGLSPETAFATIQKGIDTAGDGNQILVFPGTYTEEINFQGKAITVQSAADAAVLENPGAFAIVFCSGEGRRSVLKNFVIRGCFTGVAIAASNPTIHNATIVDNACGIAAFAGAEPDISNSIFRYNTLSDVIGCRTRYSCIQDAEAGESNIDVDPLFADPSNGDYHLRSKGGRYRPEFGIWILDDVTSPCIDAGDPSVYPTDEPMPHGGRINMGAYGGTPYASMSDTQ
jgi:hypothetical protein